MTTRSFLLSVLSVALAACGDDGGSSTTCGAGTTLVMGECVAGPAVECGEGTVLENGACVPAAAPTTCGPGTTLDNNVCVVDRTAPGPVTGLAAAVAGSNINLSWTAGASSTGTLVVRTVAGAYDRPLPGVVYMVGMTLPGGSTVVGVGNATTATDAFTVPGRYSYIAWSQNESGNYGFGREVSTVAAIPAQTGVLTLDVAANTATVTTQPSHISLALANFAFDGGTGTATVELTATNNTAGHLFNLKAIVRDVSVGTLSDPSGTAPDGDPFVALGFAARLPGGTGENTLTLTGIGATDTITLDVELVESGLAIAGGNIIDALGGTAVPAELPETDGNREPAKYTDGIPSASGRYFYVTTRWHPTLFRIDTSDGSIDSVTPFPSGNASCVELGADGYAYMAFQLGTHRSRNGYALGIAKVDPISLTVLATNELAGGNDSIAKGCAVQGATFAASYGPFVVLANADTLAFIDADPTSANVIDGVDTLAADTIRSLVFAPSGGTLYATADKTDLSIYAVNTSTFVASTYHAATTNRVTSLTVDAAGTLWWVSGSGLTSFDGVTETTVPQGVVMTSLIGIVGTKALVTSNDTNTSFTVDVTTGDQTSTGALDSNRLGHRAVFFPTP